MSARGSAPSERPPVLTGGAPRSGTTVVARLIGAHPTYEMVPQEGRFHSRSGERGIPGLIGLLEGEASVENFTHALRTYWWQRSVGGRRPRPRGLHVFVSRAELEEAVRSFEETFRRDRYAASGRLLEGLFGTVLDGTGAKGWVEMTPTNASAASTLHRCLPSMRLVHVFRDGRDAACSIAGRRWGPDTAVDAIPWWAERVRRCQRGCESLPADSLLRIRLEDLVVHDRDATYRRLLEFLDLDDHPEMRRFFDREVTAENAHIGRWQGDVPDAERESFVRRHREVVRELMAERMWWDSDS